MRLAIIVSHPIQYYSPWFRHVAAAMGCEPSGEWRVTSDKSGQTPEIRGQRSEVGDRDSLHANSDSQQNALRVFYLWDFGVTEKTDKGFGQMVKWDVDLLKGYDHEFVPNVSKRPGTDWFGGLDNPELLQRVKAFAPDAVLQFGYNYKSLVNFDLRWNTKRAPLLFRGDSHLLGESMERGAWSMEVKKRARGLGLRLLFKRFACFLAVGKANADYFRAHGVPESKIVRCPHVVDNEFFRREPEETRGLKDQESKRLRDEEPESAAADVDSVSSAIAGQGQTKRPRGLREDLGIAEDELVFLFAGKLEEKKQPLLLLEAFLRADLPKTTLLFVGSGELEGALRDRVKTGHGLTRMTEDSFRAEDLGAKSCPPDQAEDGELPAANSAHRVLFVPFQNQSAMPAVYRTGDVLVLPSKGRYETWGLAVNEAACCGVPAIVSSHVGCGPDLIEDGITGWIFEAGNVVALQRALETAAANRDRLPAMGEALRERVLAEYSYANATEALLRRLRSEKGEPQPTVRRQREA